jgi:hypothetical protein
MLLWGIGEESAGIGNGSSYNSLQRPTCSVFWIQVTDVSAFEINCRQIGKLLQIPGLEDDKADIKSLVKQHLSPESAGGMAACTGRCRRCTKVATTLFQILTKSGRFHPHQNANAWGCHSQYCQEKCDGIATHGERQKLSKLQAPVQVQRTLW